MNKPLTVSIIIPAYNEESYLKACLDAIAGQVTPPDEVIVIDNNSQDATSKIAKKYSFVTLLTEKKQGIVYARNKGFNHAHNTILARIDADSIIPPDWVKNIKTLARILPDTDAVTGPCTFRDNPLPRLSFWFHRFIYFWTSRAIFGHTILFGSNMFFFKSQWDKIAKSTCQTNSIHEDMDLSHHIASSGGKIHFVSDFQANISSRRFHKWWHYPRMWVFSRVVHFSVFERFRKR